MRKSLAIILVVLFLVACSNGCASIAKWEQSGKTDAVCSYFQTFLAGAQLGLPLFGPYAPAAQCIITTGLGITELLCKASDAYTANALKKQAYEQVQQLNVLGSKANIQQ
jgi:hypothetical protein